MRLWIEIRLTKHSHQDMDEMDDIVQDRQTFINMSGEPFSIQVLILISTVSFSLSLSHPDVTDDSANDRLSQ